MSVHIDKAISVARAKGGHAGHDDNRDLWDLSKRELIEIALHLAAASTGEYETALADGRARQRVIDEHDRLRASGIV